MRRIAIFDSGVGGLSVFDAIAAAGLSLEIDYAADNAWLPYGDKADAALRERVPLLLAALDAARKPDLIVLACNTASTIALDAVRVAISTPIVGVVPPIKPAAAQTRSGVIGLLATPATVARAYTDELIARFCGDVRVIRYGSKRLVAAAEAKLAGAPIDPGAISEAIEHMFGAADGARLDVVALACTHFPLLREELAAAAPRPCIWLDSGEAIARRVAALLGAGAAGGQALAAAALFTEPETAPRGAFVSRAFSVFGALAEPPATVPRKT